MINQSLTAIDGIRVGHAHDLTAATGCSVVLCPDNTRCAVSQAGGAPGTRETDIWQQGRLVQNVNAILLTGGSAFGLAAADGVMNYLENAGIGFATKTGVVPIVSAAVLYDLEIGGANIRPDRSMGFRACKNANSQPVCQGSVGAGTGCTVGSIKGVDFCSKGGIGSALINLADGTKVAALMAVNALGDVVDKKGNIIAGLRAYKDKNIFTSTTDFMCNQTKDLQAYGNTVIGVVATDAYFNKDQLKHIANTSQSGLAKAVSPSHTLFDGDTIFAISCGQKKGNHSTIAIAASVVVAQAIRQAVINAQSLAGAKGICDDFWVR